MRLLKVRTTSKHLPNFYKGPSQPHQEAKIKITVSFLSISGATTVKLASVGLHLAIEAGVLPDTEVFMQDS